MRRRRGYFRPRPVQQLSARYASGRGRAGVKVLTGQKFAGGRVQRAAYAKPVPSKGGK